MSTSYTVGGDTLQSVDHPNWQGQTFRVLEDHILQYIDLQMRGRMIMPEPVIQVFHADAWHEPYGDALSRNRFTVEKKSGTIATGRVRFSMQPYLLTTDFYYVIIVSNFPPLGGNPASWQYDKDDATYPGGLRISTSDGGETWTKHYDDDFIFAEFGDPPLPKPDPPPPIDNIAVLDITQTPLADGIKVTIPTSVPCHLWCYVSKIEPRKWITSRVTRGLSVPWHVHYSFIHWYKKEQLEPGDTLYHTFDVTPWAVCQTLWLTFRGEVDNIQSPSVGPIFKKHRVAPPLEPVTAYFYPDPDPEVSSVDGMTRRRAVRVTWDNLVTGVGTHAWDGPLNLEVTMRALDGVDPWWDLTRTNIVFDTSTIPAGATIQSATLDLYCKAKHDGLGALSSLALTHFVPGSHTAIVPADYQTILNDLLSDIIPYADFVIESWTTFTLNAAGLAKVTPAGWTNLAVRAHPYDILNIAPPWVNRQFSQFQFRSADTDLAKRPKLTVTYLA